MTEKHNQIRINFFDEEEQEQQLIQENNYTSKINIPQYEIKGLQPNILELINQSKYYELKQKIQQSNVSEEEKKFLYMSATRHLQFNYSLIAEYYAHASKEMQELMEQSALVIIDFEDAIKNGYTQLLDRFKEIEEKDILYNGDVDER